MSYRNQGNLKADYAPHVASPDEMGFLVLNDVGSILESGGDLTIASDLAKTFHSMAFSIMTLSLQDQKPLQPQTIQPSSSLSNSVSNVKVPVFPAQVKVQFESFFFNILITSQTRIVVTKHPIIAVSA